MAKARRSYKPLQRSNKNRIIGGVCGGLAQYFNRDPTWIRLLFLLFLLLGGSAILVYFIMWVVVPLKR